MTATQTRAAVAVRLDALIESETERFLARQTHSRRLSEEATSLAGGATSSWQVAEPHAVWISHGAGSRIHDVDGNEYADFHGGYGVSLAGHAHPAVVEAVRARVARGTHFAQPTEDAVVVADNLAERFGQPRWRFGNSGTEVTMDAVHLMRASTGRDRILKVEGGYHGHHDSVMVSVLPEPGDEIGPADAPNGVASNSGIPRGITGLVTVVPFNDLDAVDAALRRHPGEVAGMLVEPIMMNAGIILPVDGYLAGLKGLLHEHGALLTFDEVKTGLTTGPGGVTRHSGVAPDLVCLAKALGGGISAAAIGGSIEVMGLIDSGAYEQVGTFNGNPLAMAAARAMLTEVLDDAAYRHLDHLRDRLRDGLHGVVDRHDAPWRVVTAGAKGCVSFLPHPIRDFRDFRELDDRYGHAHWLVQHTDEDVDRFVANCAQLADQLIGTPR